MPRRRRCSCLFVPSKVLVQLGDLDSALASERLRGHRTALAAALLAGGVPAGEERRTVYDARHSDRLPGKLVRGEGDPPTRDPAADDAYDSAGTTYDFYWRVLGRSSIDGRGMRLDSSIHYRVRFNNAFWDGRQMVYGDGDGRLFLGFAGALDVVAHELTHGVTQYTVPGGLVYSGQSGALNESISDVFGSVVKQWAGQQTVEQADWLIGAGIMNPAVGKALRSMKDPGNRSVTWSGDDQPADMSGYVEGGDVHTNSGIPNHAFYLAATQLGGSSWEKAAPIWYRALPLLRPSASFAIAARATIAATALLGWDPPTRDAARNAVESAWRKVGVL